MSDKSSSRNDLLLTLNRLAGTQGLTSITSILQCLESYRGDSMRAEIASRIAYRLAEFIESASSEIGKPFGYFDTTEKKLYPTKAAAELMGCVESELIALYRQGNEHVD